jgi:two-component system osmolarity sensor histidine kinase EnvZ
MELDLSMPEKVQALGDSVELVRVISNLLENVSRYGRSADGIARASVTVQVQNDQVTLVLRDQGPGVTQEVLNHLTEPFYRADTARTSAAGAGLGLAIVQKALLRMGGQLTLSVPPEGGLQVQITLRGVA